MSKTYVPAAEAVTKRVAALIKKYHPQLSSLRVKVEVLMVSSDSGHALTLHGHPCDGIVRAISTKERAAGRADAEILIDRESYAAMNDAQRDALLDHELYHLVVKLDRVGDMKEDSNGRPVLKLRKHDYEVGWFHEIAARHGEASSEVQQARFLLHRQGQTYFNFTADQHEAAKASAPLLAPVESIGTTQSAKGKKTAA